MPTRRMIHTELWQSESIGRLNCTQRLLFIGLFSNADDQGRLPGHPAAVRAAVFMYDDFTLEQIDADLQTLADGDFIIRYESNDKSLIQVTNWWTYQTPQWAYPSSYPPPEGWVDCIRGRKNHKVYTENWPPPQWNRNAGADSDTPDDDQDDDSGDALGQALGKDPGNALGESDKIDQNSDSVRGRDSLGADAPQQLTPALAARGLIQELYGTDAFTEGDLAQLDAVTQSAGLSKVLPALQWCKEKDIDHIGRICTTARQWRLYKSNGHRGSTGPPGQQTPMEQAKALLRKERANGGSRRDSGIDHGADGGVSRF